MWSVIVVLTANSESDVFDDVLDDHEGKHDQEGNDGKHTIAWVERKVVYSFLLMADLYRNWRNTHEWDASQHYCQENWRHKCHIKLVKFVVNALTWVVWQHVRCIWDKMTLLFHNGFFSDCSLIISLLNWEIRMELCLFINITSARIHLFWPLSLSSQLFDVKHRLLELFKLNTLD